MTYATDRLFEEVAYVAYHFHWPMDTILDMEHPLRLRFVEEIGRINTRLSEGGATTSGVQIEEATLSCELLVKG